MSDRVLKSTVALTALLAIGLAAPALATPDTLWRVDATFDDGATLKGFLDFNGYGYIKSWDLKTTAGPDFAAFDFSSSIAGVVTPSQNTIAGDSFTFYNGPSYLGDVLTLIASKPFNSASSGNTLLATSVESVNYLSPSPTRYLTAPTSLAAPEPAAWALMLVGVAAIGSGLRQRRRGSPVAA
jgi:hypothetical protein